MRNKLYKIATAILALAITFTISCSSTGYDLNMEISSSSRSSSSKPAVPSSSSVGNGSSSSVPSSSSAKASSSSSVSTQTEIIYGTPVTYEGETYQTVVIGTQTWMAKNLNFETETGSKCYNDNTLNCTLYGRLYNWEAAMNACPAGWHLPSDLEWVVLEDFIGGKLEDAWKKLRATSNIVVYKGTDDYGFNANVIASDYATFWTSTEKGTSAYYRNIALGSNGTKSKSSISSVRCLKGDSYHPSSPSYTPVNCPSVPAGGFCDDRDGKGYKSVTIDGKIWMAENLNFNAEGGKCYGEGGQVILSGSDFITLSDSEIQANCATYGRLYDWSTAMALAPACYRADCSSWITEKHKGICPSGWHVPSKAELQGLITSAGGTATAGQILKATSGWTEYQQGNSSNGADLLGFSALPGGSGYGSSYYGNIGILSFYWSSTTGYSIDKAEGLSIGYSSGASVSDESKSYLRSLRCAKD